MSLTLVSAPGRPVYTTAPPASRASWTGQLRVAHLTIPVKAYAAVVTPESPLKQLHAGCGERIEYRKWCPKHGIVPNDAIIKGYPYGTDSYVQLAEEELTALQPADDKTLLLEQFLDRDQLDLILLSGRSLYLAPSLPAARQPFALLLAALRSTEKWAIGPRRPLQQPAGRRGPPRRADARHAHALLPRAAAGRRRDRAGRRGVGPQGHRGDGTDHPCGQRTGSLGRVQGRVRGPAQPNWSRPRSRRPPMDNGRRRNGKAKPQTLAKGRLTRLVRASFFCIACVPGGCASRTAARPRAILTNQGLIS